MRRAAAGLLSAGLALLLVAPAAAQTVLDAVVVAEPCTQVQPSSSYCQFFQSTGAATIVFAPVSSTMTGEIWTTDGSPAGTSVLPLPEVFAGFGASTTQSGLVLFLADDFSCGLSLWATDGSVAGTRLVKDLIPGPESSLATEYASMGGITYFKTQDGRRQDTGELWRTDGTTAGTYSLGRWGHGIEIGALDTLLVFACGADPRDSAELCVSDGSVAGTGPLADLNPAGGSNPSGFTRLGARLVFTATDDVNGKEPWVTDGTTLGTTLLRDIKPGSSAGVWYPDNFAGDGARAFFAADDGAAGSEPWVTDGTTAGTVMVADIRPGAASSSPDSMCTWNGRAYFAADDGLSGRELWSSDGTALGTTLVADINPGAGGSFPWGLVATPWGVAFAANDGATGTEPWISDGTPAGTRQLADIEPGAGGSDPSYLQVAGGRLYFDATTPGMGSEPWVSDGTPAGTMLLANMAPDGTWSWPHDLVVASGRVHFVATDCGASGTEPWMSDGTAAGTVLAADIAPGSDSSYVAPVAIVDGRMVGASSYPAAELWSYAASGGDAQLLAPIEFGFGARLPSHAITPAGMIFPCADPALGTEPCVTDGTSAGTRVLEDMAPGPASSLPVEFATTGTRAVFITSNAFVSPYQLVSTDLTAAGTIVLDPPQQPTLRDSGNWGDGRTTLFVKYDDPTGIEPWITDGTQAGTRFLADLRPGPESSWIASATPFRGGYLLSVDAGAGAEPYFTDGTAPGTVSLGDLLPGPNGSRPSEMTDLASFALFAAGDETNGAELWRTDGTPAGTRLVKDIRPGALGSGPRELVAIAPGLALFTANDGVEGREIWISDGTDAGTRLWARIAPGRAHGYPTELVRLGNRVLFSGDPGGGPELMTVVIPPEAGSCANGGDDDFDARIDCDDADCVFDPACAGLDWDGDGVRNGSDCAPEDPGAFAMPAELVDLEVDAAPAGAGVDLSWSDPAPPAGSATAVSVASASLADLRASTWPCLAEGAVSPLRDDRAGTWAYVARAENACGPTGTDGWGADSRGVPRGVPCP